MTIGTGVLHIGRPARRLVYPSFQGIKPARNFVDRLAQWPDRTSGPTFSLGDPLGQHSEIGVGLVKSGIIIRF